jgi:large subunit ribosomal protein L6
MSRIGKLPISVPTAVTVTVDEQQEVIVNGPFGTLKRILPTELEIKVSGGKVFIGVLNESKKARASHGLFRTLINNMILGVNTKFEIDLQLKGVGYRCQLGNDKVLLSLGFSHSIDLPIPQGIEVKVDDSTKIKILGIDKEQVGFFASKIRSSRPPEPYNGKGVLYKNEVVVLKAGKVGKK